jgi:UDP-N-acetylmuramate dehydrogenase
MQILKNFDLKGYNTFGFKAIASNFVAIANEDDLTELVKSNILHEMPWFILGGGSNVLFTQDFNGLIIHLENKGIHVAPDGNTHVLVTAEAGEDWVEFADKMVELKYGGAENLVAIPGLCGSCAVQNIGAYGVEACNIIHSVRYFDLAENTFKTIAGSDCKYGYRDSIFKHELKGKAIITNVTFRLTKKYHQIHSEYSVLQNELNAKGIQIPTIQIIADIVKDIRRSKLPDVKELGSAGSFFKNPYLDKSSFEELKKQYPTLVSYPIDPNTVKLAAGQLIELCGWRGKMIDHVGVHIKQALILVHYGEGTGQEIVDLSKEIIEDVHQQFGVTLAPEVIFV